MNRIETAYSDTNIRVYLLFSNDSAIDNAMKQANLPEQEQKEMMECVRSCIFDGTMYRTLVVHRKPGKKLVSPFRQMAREIFEVWPLESHIITAKGSGNIEDHSAIHNFGAELPAYTGRLHNFA